MTEGANRRTQRRFEDYVQKTADGCWLWTGPINDDGYGTWSGDGDKGLAHRIAWARANGPIPAGLGILHRCDNPPCVNWEDHLYPGTQAQNMRDMTERGRRHYPPLRKTCEQRHPLSGSNLVVYTLKSGEVHRCCRTCRREWNRKHKAAARLRRMGSRPMPPCDRLSTAEVVASYVASRRSLSRYQLLGKVSPSVRIGREAYWLAGEIDSAFARRGA